jgi:two-component system probable response regulator PhcQ
MNRILLVDDEASILKALRRVLSLVPCRYDGLTYRLEIDLANSPEEALEKIRHVAYDLILSDFRMPGMDGVALLKEAMTLQPEAARMILSGYADLESVMKAINEAQIVRFLSKPWNDYELVSAIGQALAYRALLVENRRLADLVRVQQGKLTAEDFERKRLEDEEPGITQVRWGPDGSVMLDEDLARQLESRD